VLKIIFTSRGDDLSGECGRWHTEEIRDPYFLPNFILVIISRRTRCVGIWHRWGRGIFLFLLWELERTKNLLALGNDESIILNGSARNGSSLDWDDLSLDGDLCQALT
jgi:hypothetical protein